jgi:hypothetical protein
LNPKRIGRISLIDFGFLAAPALKQEMLSILVTLPIVLAPESLIAVGEGTSIWALVTLDMFTEGN